MALFRQSVRGFREQCMPEEEGASQLLAGLLCLERNKSEVAVRLLQVGRATLDPEARPWLTVRAGLSLAQALAETGHGVRAVGVLGETRRQYGQTEGEDAQISIHWLEGKVGLRLGRHEEAASLLAAVRQWFLTEGRLGEALLCTLDLAAALVQGLQSAELPELLAEVETAFASGEMGVEALQAAHLPEADLWPPHGVARPACGCCGSGTSEFEGPRVAYREPALRLRDF
jgi:hypothetical protein